MKKIVAILLLLTLSVLMLFSCGNQNTTLNIGYMSGPTGMGMAKLINDNKPVENESNKYSFNKYSDTKTATQDLLAGRVDIICMPTNEAAALYASQPDSQIVVLAVNTFSSLFLLTDKQTTITSLSELEGKTIYTCKNGTPRVVIEYLLDALKIDANVSYTVDNKEIATPAQLGEQLVAGKIDIAVVPEPIVTSSTLAIKNNGNSDIAYSVDLKLEDVWTGVVDSPMTMGCVVSTKKFISENKKAINAFLNEYKASIEFVSSSENLDASARYIVDAGILGATGAAKNALNNLSGAISYLDGEKMKEALESFYKALDITLPGNDFYYEK